ncbi:hypothetical protein KUTeg_015222 [Tegillarca granosa]|uniref:Uncharacterized protein n=1 Tax=Tegillarca granosa TaxID=220873 RepID=A0ABQ9EV07_TEGGR|nr:hypothetical protein KUTeg_015222 [Tegillarca granosa]
MASEDLPVLGGNNFLMGESATEGIEVEEKIDWDDLNSALSQEAERKLTLSPHSEDEDGDEEEDDDYDVDEKKEISRYPEKHPPHEYNWQNQLRKHDYQQGDQNKSSKNSKQIKRKEQVEKQESETKPETKEESSSSEDDSDEEEEERRTEILIYDPANKQALEFQPLIEEKMQLVRLILMKTKGILG